ncbi:MAG: penicillin-binding protein 2 [Acidobacteriota bacterium]
MSDGTTALESPAEKSRLSLRLRIAEGLVILLVTLLLLGFWRLQIVHASHYRELAENNRRRDEVVLAPRGLITDRNGLLLAANRPAYNVAVVREDLVDTNQTLTWLGRVLDQPVEELQARLARHRQTPGFRPVIIAEDVRQSIVAAVEARRREYPGVRVQVELKRFYPEGSLAAHALGHVGEITRAQLDSWDRDRFHLGDIVGQNGLERVHNEALMGRGGQRKIIVNSTGRTVRVLDRRPPDPGKTLTLTLDLQLQRRAEAELAGKHGTVVVLDVRTGGVLALASSPTFDPNIFAARFSAGAWSALVHDPAEPLQNRALQSHYPPGSVFKLIMAVAGLEEGVITPETTVFCPGGRTIFGHFYSCLAGGHGTVRLRQALGRSCNVYFYEVGRQVGRKKIIAVAKRFGLGSPTGIDLPNEDRGTLPTDEWLEANRNGQWFPGETIVLSIGQGPIDVTPIQMVRMAAILGSGHDVRPHLVEKEEEAAAHSTVVPLPIPIPRPRPVKLDPTYRKLVLEGMWAVVNENGTGWRARQPGLNIGGKTGTAQVASSELTGPESERPEELRNHAWFIGLAPIDNPQVAVAVLIEHGGGGGAAAAPVAGRILATYLSLPPRPRPAIGDDVVVASHQPHRRP